MPPFQILVPIAVGPEIPCEGIQPLRAAIEDLLPGTVVAPMYLRGRAIGVLMAIGAADDALRDLAAEGAAAITLAETYTDHIDTVRRLTPTSAAAEIQQHLVPPRGDRLLLLSDGVLDRPIVDGATLGLDGVLNAVLKAPPSRPPEPCARSRTLSARPSPTHSPTTPPPSFSSRAGPPPSAASAPQAFSRQLRRSRAPLVRGTLS
ncbi:serine/threonine-protein phosphatase [Solirubrobacter soli]|uniref:serine/threonine-protein phosphatase n=1 Tax=Solirubrobacter soli TaxID=363832 RepID=UPI001FE0D090|nr:serine/threonine-protein phosphatase [Solirubrobacter soli]